MSYNIRHALGADDRVDLARIAGVIAPFEPDVVGLQEVDAGRARSSGVDQAGELAERLGMHAEFAVCIEQGCERYGIATLTKPRVLEVRQLPLPGFAHREPRRALLTRLEWPGPGKSVAVVNTHLSTKAAERPGQVAAIAELAADDELIVLGDLNCTPWSRALRPLRPKLRSATKRTRSWPARAPLFPIDHILVGGPLEVVESGSWRGGDAKRASDHLPVIAVLEAA